MIELECKNCISLITVSHLPSHIEIFRYDGCVWLNMPKNSEYNNNVKKLVKIQRWYRSEKIRRKITQSKEIKNLLPMAITNLILSF